jgi:amidohydrolase
VTGRGGHGAYPHLSVDPMTAAAHILIGMQSLVTKEVAARETVVLTVGQLLAGTKNNIIPDKAVMRGTLRTFDMSVREQMLGRLQSFTSDMARAYRAEAQVDLTMGCPPVVNPEREAALVHRCAADELGEAAVIAGNPVMASDDMGLFLRERPGCYFRVGIAPATGPERPHHAPEFEMNEDGLPVGLRVALSVLTSRLGA